MPIPQTNQGWIPDGGHNVVAIGLPTLKAAVPEILLDVEPSVPILLYRAYYDVLGGYPAYKAQEIGSCVGHSHAHAMDCLQCVEIALGEPSEYRETSAEFVYAASRAIAGILGPFDGSYGSAAVKALLRTGACSREMLGPDGVDSGRIAKAWGRTGPPDRYVQAAVAFKLGAVARITDRASAVSALWNGSPITICSSQGFTMVRDRDGCCKPSGRWDHAMHITGYDPGKKRYLIVQSWGPNTPQGPLYLDQPDYSFWADAGVVERRIFSAGDSWALFRAPEFARRSLPSGWAKVA